MQKIDLYMSWKCIQHSCTESTVANRSAPTLYLTDIWFIKWNMIHKVHSVLEKLAEWSPHVYMGKCKQKPSFNMAWNSCFLCVLLLLFFYFFFSFFGTLFCCQHKTGWRAGKEDSHIRWWCSWCLFMFLCGQICCFLVWANLLMLWWNITGVTVFNPIGPTNIISRCLIMLNVGSAQGAFGSFGIYKTCSETSAQWAQWLFSKGLLLLL